MIEYKPLSNCSKCLPNQVKPFSSFLFFFYETYLIVIIKLSKSTFRITFQTLSRGFKLSIWNHIEYNGGGGGGAKFNELLETNASETFYNTHYILNNRRVFAQLCTKIHLYAPIKIFFAILLKTCRIKVNSDGYINSILLISP